MDLFIFEEPAALGSSRFRFYTLLHSDRRAVAHRVTSQLTSVLASTVVRFAEILEEVTRIPENQFRSRAGDDVEGLNVSTAL